MQHAVWYETPIVVIKDTPRFYQDEAANRQKTGVRVFGKCMSIHLRVNYADGGLSCMLEGRQEKRNKKEEENDNHNPKPLPRICWLHKIFFVAIARALSLSLSLSLSFSFSSPLSLSRSLSLSLSLSLPLSLALSRSLSLSLSLFFANSHGSAVVGLTPTIDRGNSGSVTETHRQCAVSHAC